MFRLTADEMGPGLAPNVACIASDRITVDGRPVGYMYVDEYGWTFVAGDEDQTYLDDPNHLGVYSLNDMANFDRAIIPHLNSPLGSAFLRRGDTFVADPDGAPTEPEQATPTLHPGFPVIHGRQAISRDWSVTLPEPVNARREDGATVLWRPGLTARLTAWNNDRGEPRANRLEKLKTHASPSAFDHALWSTHDALYWTYRLVEQASDDRLPALYGYVVADAGHVQLALYVDTPDDLASAQSLVRGIAPIT
jgi:hypothetical protein